MTDEAGDSDLRRRAAWLLALLVVVAVLLVVLFVTLLHTSSSNKQSGGGGSSYPTSPTTPAASSPAQSSSPSPTSSTPTFSPQSCNKLCVVDGDPGNAQDAINQYRAQHGRNRIDTSVSKAAQNCAFSNGANCKGGWAETQVPNGKGKPAVVKIAPLARLLDPNLKSVQVGWAYDPNGHQYYFAVIRQD